MIADHPIAAIVQEAVALPRTVKGLGRLRFTLPAMARFLFWRVFMPESGSRSGKVVHTPEGISLARRRDFVMYASLFAHDEYRADLWGRELAQQSGPLILDVGANLGFFALRCWALCHAARLRCFELIPECAAAAESRLRQCGCGDYRVINAAVGAVAGGHLTVRYDTPSSATNSTTQDKGVFYASVPRVALDDWFPREELRSARPFLVKIDVEGCERDVITGGLDVLTSSEFILLELHDTHETLNLLTPSHTVLSDVQTSPVTWVCVLRRRQ